MLREQITRLVVVVVMMKLYGGLELAISLADPFLPGVGLDKVFYGVKSNKRKGNLMQFVVLDFAYSLLTFFFF